MNHSNQQTKNGEGEDRGNAAQIQKESGDEDPRNDLIFNWHSSRKDERMETCQVRSWYRIYFGMLLTIGMGKAGIEFRRYWRATFKIRLLYSTAMQ